MTTNVRTPLLEIRNLTVRFGGLTAISELDLAVEEGQIFALVGPNGAGKTTVLNCISGFVTPAAGTILFAGTSLLPLARHQRAGLGIGRTFQLLQLFSSMTVMENLLVAQHAHWRAGSLSSILPFRAGKTEGERAREQAMAVLAMLGLESYAHRRAGMLPLGVQKLVGVARALVLRPRLVLLDEPAAGITHQEMGQLVANLHHIREQTGATLLLIEHNMQVIQAVADHVCVLDYGRKLAEGTPREVLSHPDVLEAYLGRDAQQVAQHIHIDVQPVKEDSHAEG
ncbi:MAG: ABC transporter ATP-binding protein [Ktedonobacteraceae bacterium]|nr:ABC transporter ATP-binding protein [Ktedonobacteraceae bacterium]